MAQEIEIKLDLGSFANYLKLRGHLGGSETEEHQHNAFFDTPDSILKQNGWALRVRTTDDKGYVTVKGVTSSSGMAAVREENESEISHATALSLVKHEVDILSVDARSLDVIRPIVENRSLHPFLFFDNTRHYHDYKIGDIQYQLEIDRTEFMDGHVDYELEVELTSEKEVETVEHALRRFFAGLEIPFKPQPKSKFARALAHNQS